MVLKRAIKYLLFIFTFLYYENSKAQEVVTTRDGEKIILQEDGTWKTMDEDKEISSNNESTCNFNVLEKDHFVEEQWIVMQSASFLSVTKDQHQDIAKWDQFTKADLYCLYIGGNFGAYFRFEIASDSAQELLGGLSGDNKLKIFTENNPPIVAAFEDQGVKEEKDFQDVTLYKNNVRLSNDQVEVLLKSPVQKIGIEWDKKYLEYPLNDQYIFRDQLTCIIQKI